MNKNQKEHEGAIVNEMTRHIKRKNLILAAVDK
jgi:hypothetical protein